MSYAPASIQAVRELLHDQAGVALVSLGIVGNAKHLSGYHLGRDRIYDGDGPGKGARDYSVMTSRDRAGLTDAASAIDIGRMDAAHGSHGGTRRMAAWIVAQAKKGARDALGVREVIYSPDGVRVVRWDREGIPPKTGDSSHLTHAHISWYRDTERADRVALFERYLEVDDMAALKSYPCPERTDSVVAIDAGTWLFVWSDFRTDPDNVQVSPSRDFPYLGKPAGVPAVAYDRSPDIPGASALFIKGAVTPSPAPAPGQGAYAYSLTVGAGKVSGKIDPTG